MRCHVHDELPSPSGREAAPQFSEDTAMSITPPPVIPAPALPAATRSSRARVPLDQPTGLIGRALNFYATRKYGQVLDNLLAMAHNPRVLLTDARFEMSVARWKKLDPQLKSLAVMLDREPDRMQLVPGLRLLRGALARRRRREDRRGR